MMNRQLSAACVAVAIAWGGVVASAWSVPAQAPQAPAAKSTEADGRAILGKLCVDCHAADAVMRQRRTLTGWEEIIDTMVAQGAGGTDDELQKAIQYLAVTVGKVNVNKDNARNLQAVLEIPAPLADALIKGRPYAAIADLARVPGLDIKAITEKSERVVF